MAAQRILQLLLLAVVLWTGGCLALVGIQDNYEIAEISTSGAGSAAPSGAGTGGGDTCDPAMCPPPDGPCIRAVCKGGQCTEEMVPEGGLSPWDTPGDCKRLVCNADGTAGETNYMWDVLDDGIECTLDECSDGTPLNTPVAVGAACSQNGGAYCSAAGDCVECTEQAHCASSYCAPDGRCLPAHCGDSQQNNGETDVDCGGPCIATCEPGESCSIDADCAGSLCESGVCGPIVSMMKHKAETRKDGYHE